MRLTSPRIVTFVVSLGLAALAVSGLRLHVPAIDHVVAEHRNAVLTAAYGLLAAGVVFRQF
jgi:hypothetical protein